MIILIIIAWLTFGLIGSRLEYLFLKAPWTEEYHEREFKKGHIKLSLFFAVFGAINFIAGVILYFMRDKDKFM